ncbi:AMP-binding enzyme family protein [Pleurostoma richardsiae]|uniref:AMP-binding enzyme family protein n=1 Tax=Pleurostoma richardsiae TaxID=41990 RepID=A0AA38RFP6_9PEZI|nr:AMP-binding enzyme family protein [Pleurostoma richardsiae]
MSPSFPAGPIAIIGSGCRFPGEVNNPSKLWELLREPHDVSRSIDRFHAPGFYHRDGHYHGASNVSDAYLLSEDPRVFDAQFFNIQAGEAESIDPQQRLLLETVYEGLESAGLALEDLKGSPTAVFVGVMCDDYAGLVYHDSESIPTYAATGISRAILSNRLSYVFDWRGPSMTIDTACSSSLVAVHQAVQVLRNGTAKLAVAAGVNLIFSPNMFIAESNLNMLSATGKSQMWDAAANGYARGEGIGAVILKPLSAAIADGDHIECVVRETGLNQDGHTSGITMPNSDAQVRLILDTYARAGLDLRNPADRCQYFEAHGTGTKAGDGVESRAIYHALFPSDVRVEDVGPLYVGSIKTVVGHTEGAAGIAGVLRASLAISHETIPPNLHFSALNPDIASFYGPLQIATEPQAWPAVPTGGVRRASVNSFGFGGANAHAILEGFDPAYHGHASRLPTTSPVNPLPLVLSATSEKSLANLVRAYLDYLHQHPHADLHSLAATLFHRRSTFAFRTAFAGQSVEALLPCLQATLEDKTSPLASPLVRATAGERRLLGVFTGQGAQWATMGCDLIRASPLAEAIVDRLEAALQELPAGDRPAWSLKEQLLVDADRSRIAEGELSQPLCTVLQILLVDLLRVAGVTFDRVVGHSSGEIGAAYAAGFLSAADAIKVAYYRGRFARLARGPAGQRGAMIAAGTDMADALDLVGLPAFAGRVGLAAWNSSSSTTLSGDADAVQHIELVLQDESKFNRLLKVDTAYHSHHMHPCSGPYREALAACRIQIQKPNGATRWYSSVYSGRRIDADTDADTLRHDYWVQNMVSPVLFSAAVEAGLRDGIGDGAAAKPPTMAVEVGPHPALKGPATSTIEEVLGTAIPYAGTVTRGRHDVDALAATLGSLWTVFGRAGADLQAYARLFVNQEPALVRGLPAYPWNHDRTFWYESRESRMHRFRPQPAHPLLGVRVHAAGQREYRWRNYLSPTEVAWLPGHKIQGQTLMPAAAFLTMAIEAGRLAVEDAEGDDAREVQLIELSDAAIHRALGFLDDRGVETLFSLSQVAVTSHSDGVSVLTADFQCDACPSRDAGSFVLMASGRVTVRTGPVSPSLLLPRPAADVADRRLSAISIDHFYGELASLGYNYTELFKGVTALQRTTSHATGEIVSTWSDPDKTTEPEPYCLHPSVLDVAFQTIFAAVSHPGDGSLWTLHIPTTIKRVVINPAACPPDSALHVPLAFSTRSYVSDTGAITGDIGLFVADADGGAAHALAQIEALAVSPIAPATEKDDRQMFADTYLFPLHPDADAVSAATPAALCDDDQAGVATLERITLYYVRQLLAGGGSDDETPSALRDWAQSVVDLAASGLHPTARAEWLSDTLDDIEAVAEMLTPGSALRADYERIAALGGQAREDGVPPSAAVVAATDQLVQFYETSLGTAQSCTHLAALAKQIAMRFPQMRVLELGAGEHSATAELLAALSDAFGTYTVAGVSDAHFAALQESYPALDSRLSAVALRLDQDAQEQELAGGVYDLVIAPYGLPATRRALRNVRFLLKPGGYLAARQASGAASLRAAYIVGHLAAPAEQLSEGSAVPLLEDWDALLQVTGFTGVDTATSDTVVPFSAFVAQAVDAEMTAVRQPLASKAAVGHLLIIGGQHFPVARLARELERLLAPHCKSVRVIRSLDHLDVAMLAAKPLVLSLTELDAPFFHSVTGLRFENLQELFDRSHQVLWVVRGAQGANPYANMMKGMVRTMISEFPGLFVQILNLESRIEGAGRVIAETLLRLHISQQWKAAYHATWSVERELTSDQGKLFVTRYLPNRALDLGYNTIRRRVETDVSPDDPEVVLEVIADDARVHALSLRRHRLSPVTSGLHADELAAVAVMRSLACSVRIGKLGYLHLVSGVDQKTGAHVLALSEQHQSIVTVPRARLVPLDLPRAQERAALLAIAGIMAAAAILDDTAAPGAVILHEPAPLLAHFVATVAAAKGLRPIFTTVRPDLAGEPHWAFVHAQSPDSVIQTAVADDVAVFVDCSRGAPMAEQQRRHLPFGARRQVLEDFLNTRAAVHPGVDEQQLQEALSDALALAAPGLAALPAVADEELTIQRLAEQSRQAAGPALSTIDWTGPGPVRARVKSALEEVTFRPDRTYFLVGMTGSLGLSTVMYMLARGARYFALASRSPKVDERWLRDTQRAFGATIRVLALDITSKKAVQDTCADLAATMPPVAGVANAALVICDALFLEMDADRMNQALGPKVAGSQHLDEVFGDADLDFFILYSSLVYVTGNPGQTAYCAGNGFLVGLAHGRRARGKTASVMNLAGISGLGFIARTDHGILARLDLMGYGVISEHDYLYLFAEAVLAGPPGSGRNPEVSGGLRFVDPAKDQGVPKWVIDPKFSHYLLDRSSSSTGGVDAGDARGSVKAALLEATSVKEALAVVLDALLAMLHKRLRLPAEETVPADIAVVELGVDSLVAVEMRQWFTDEFDVNIPVMKMLGGATLTDLAEDAVSEMAAELIPLVKAAQVDGDGDDKAGETPAEAVGSPGSASETASQSDSFEHVSAAVLSSATSDVSGEDFVAIDGNSRDAKPAKLVDSAAATAVAKPSRPVFQRKVKMAIAATRFWFLRQYLGDDSCFNVVFRLRMTGRVDEAKVGETIRKLGNRHEVFRTTFYFDDKTNEPMQGVLPETRLRVEMHKIAGEDEAAARTDAMMKHRFDLEGGEAIRIAWLSLSPQDHFMVIACHHIAFDGFSTNLILSELDLLYRDQRMPAVQRQFTDFAVQQRREVDEGRMAKEVAFWRGVYPDVPDPLPLFPLAGVRRRAALTAYAHDEASLTLDKALVAKIRTGVRQHRATVFHFMLAVYEVFLFRFLRVEDLAIGIADANRQDVKSLTTMGFLLNLLPLRFRAPAAGDAAPFGAVLQAARDTARAALENSRLPFDVLLNEVDAPRSAAYSPLFQVFLDYKQYAVKMPRILKAQAEGERFDGATGYDMVLDVKDISGGDFIVTVRTQKALYPSHADVLLRSFMHLLNTFAKDFKAETTTAALFSEDEAAKAVQLGRGPSLRREWPEALSHRIDDVAAQHPNDIAVRDGLGSSYTYAALQKEVDAIGDSLLLAGVMPGQIVAVFQEPSARWICSLLAIWRVGAVYVPLDPKRGLPALASIAAGVKPQVVLCSATTVSDVPALSTTAGVINVDTDVAEAVAHTANRASAAAPAVILFTSGSTGTPKGIEIAHASLVNLLEGYSRTFDLGRPVVLQHTTYSFDIALDQIITGLGLGGSLYVASAAQRQDPRQLADAVADAGITYAKATPSEFVSWISHGRAALTRAAQWRWAVIGGEHWNDTLRAAFHSLQLPVLELQNCYGPTEFTIVCAKQKIPVDKEIEVLSAGRALPNLSLYIADDQVRALPTGVLGEVVVGGAGAALGYLNNPELTKEKFVADCYAPAEYLEAGWNKAYRTGDLGYLQADGSLVYTGRIAGDTQVKLRGVRIELEDIESNIVNASAGAVDRAVASVRGVSPAQVLVAFVEFAAAYPADGRSAFLSSLLARLPLPQYMTPGLLIELPGGIPLNSHNKIDRRAVNSLPLLGADATAAEADLTPTERALREIWLELLPEDVAQAVAITRHSNFFHVGGNSLMAISLQKLVRARLGVVVPLVKLLEASTLASLAAIVDVSNRAKPVDWDAETALDADVLAVTAGPGAAPIAAGPRTVLLTGAAGFVGSHILEALLASLDVARVHAVAVRPLPDADPRRARLCELIAQHPDRVVLHAGDLAAPRLGLSEAGFAALAGEVDVVVHSGGSRSFWDGYAAMRGDNVASTRALICLAARARADHGRTVALHYISAGEAEVAAGPPRDGSAAGYLATKWVSEQLLGRAAAHLGVPVAIHRMRPADEIEGGPEGREEEEEKDALFVELALLAKKIGSVPTTQGSTWAGRWDLMPARRLAETVVDAALEPGAVVGVRFVPLRASVAMTMDEVTQRMGEVDPALTEGMTRVPGHVWFGQAKLAGLTYQVTSMDVSLQGTDGRTVGELQR